MKPILIIAGCAFLAWSASASDVYVVTDSKGNRVYTDRPEQLPAEKVTVRTSPADTAAPQKATSIPATAPPEAAKAGPLTVDDLAKRCAEARRRYEVAMNSSRLYEQGPEGARRYLSPEEINTARINAKQTMDTFCGGQ